MASLSAHLCQPEAHGTLRFRVDCPLCRAERLVGSFERGGRVSSRAPAALAAGVLAFSVVPAPAVAADGDSQQEGTAPVTQTGGADSSENPSFDPGGSSENLPTAAPALPQAPASSADGSDDTGPIDQAPSADTSDPVVDPGDGLGPQSSQPPPVAPGATAAPSATSPSVAAQPPVQTPAPQSSATAPASTAQHEPSATSGEAVAVAIRAVQSASELPAVERHRRPASSRVIPISDRTPAPAASAPVAAGAPAHRASSRRAVTEPSVVRVRAAARAKPGDRAHAVLAGESLWSIANDVLGGGASPARVAREVHRIWERNRERIGTGNPDLLMVGTTLRLP